MRGNHTPSTVHGLDRLHGESGGHQVVSVVSAPAHHEQAFDLSYHKDQAALCDAGTRYYFSVQPFKDRVGRELKLPQMLHFK